MRSRLLIALVGFASLVCSSGAFAGPGTEENREATPMQESKVVGQVYIYGNRYVLKEADGKQCFILLENPILEKLIANASFLELYQVEGEVYGFKDTRYFLPRKFEKIANAPQEIIQVGTMDTDHGKDKKGKAKKSGLKKGKKGGKKEKDGTGKKVKKSKKGGKKAKKSKSSSDSSEKKVKKAKKNSDGTDKQAKKAKKAKKDSDKKVKKDKKSKKSSDKKVKKEKKAKKNSKKEGKKDKQNRNKDAKQEIQSKDGK